MKQLKERSGAEQAAAFIMKADGLRMLPVSRLPEPGGLGDR